MLKKSSLSFLQHLKENNNRDWFQANKHLYADAQEDFENLITRLIPRINQFDATIGSLEASDCIFRIYRDVRFSASKLPYKCHFGAYIAPSGRKSTLAGYYVHIEPQASYLSGGIYMASNPTMLRIRNEIAALADEFLLIVEGEEFKAAFTSLGDESLKKMPK